MEFNIADTLLGSVRGNYKLSAIILQLKYGEVEIGPPTKYRNCEGGDGVTGLTLQVINDFAEKVEIEYQPAAEQEDTKWKFFCDGQVLKTVVPFNFWKTYWFPDLDECPPKVEDTFYKQELSNEPSLAGVRMQKIYRDTNGSVREGLRRPEFVCPSAGTSTQEVLREERGKLDFPILPVGASTHDVIRDASNTSRTELPQCGCPPARDSKEFTCASRLSSREGHRRSEELYPPGESSTQGSSTQEIILDLGDHNWEEHQDGSSAPPNTPAPVSKARQFRRRQTRAVFRNRQENQPSNVDLRSVRHDGAKFSTLRQEIGKDMEETFSEPRTRTETFERRIKVTCARPGSSCSSAAPAESFEKVIKVTCSRPSSSAETCEGLMEVGRSTAYQPEESFVKDPFDQDYTMPQPVPVPDPSCNKITHCKSFPPRGASALAAIAAIPPASVPSSPKAENSLELMKSRFFSGDTNDTIASCPGTIPSGGACAKTLLLAATSRSLPSSPEKELPASTDTTKMKRNTTEDIQDMLTSFFRKAQSFSVGQSLVIGSVVKKHTLEMGDVWNETVQFISGDKAVIVKPGNFLKEIRDFISREGVIILKQGKRYILAKRKGWFKPNHNSVLCGCLKPFVTDFDDNKIIKTDPVFVSPESSS